MSSDSRLQCAGPRNFSVVRNFLEQSAYWVDGPATMQRTLHASRPFSEIYCDRCNDPVAMLNIVSGFVRSRISQTSLAALKLLESEGGSPALRIIRDSSILRPPATKQIPLRLAYD